LPRLCLDRTLRTRTPQVLEDRSTTIERYPSAAPILEGSDLEAAACLPLLVDDVAVGYLAAHYRGPHRFDPAELLMLGIVAAVCAGVVGRLRAATLPVHVPPKSSELAAEVDGLRTAMANRASIEQAMGMLMERFELGPEAAWAVMRRLSSVLNLKVRDLADALIGAVRARGWRDRRGGPEYGR
jgi:hypothetical protein